MPLFSGKPVFVLGTGIHLPERVLTNQDLEKMVDTTDEWIVERTGIRTRHIAAPGELTSDIAYAAGLEALRAAGMKAEDLDMVLVATNSPTPFSPGSRRRYRGSWKRPTPEPRISSLDAPAAFMPWQSHRPESLRASGKMCLSWGPKCFPV